MKILYITRFFPKDYYGGGEQYIFEIWKIAREKYETYLLSGWVNNPKLLPKGTKCVDLSSESRVARYSRLYNASKKYIEEIKPDLIHTNTVEIPTTKIPTIATYHHFEHLKKLSLFGIIRRTLVVNKLNMFSKIITVSNSSKNGLVKLGVNSSKITVIHDGVDVKKFSPKIVRNKKFVISCIFRISSEKGQDVVVNAIGRLSQNVKNNIEVEIVGYVSDKRYFDYIVTRARKFKLPIKFITNVPDLVKYYQKSDLVLFPTLLNEGFGIVACEAMSCGKPLIASNHSSIREVVGNCALLVKPNDSEELSNAIMKVYSDRKLAAKLGKCGRKRVLKMFNWDKSFNLHENVYREVLRKQ